ncbi:cysteine--tRNA ligase [Aliarcobacter thereius]|uniref:Cysteine--tRNA ligase n=2 Tax=Aliarcobacter thereius TaxID=544718 RepID=A0A1C0B8E6_9BACT|nr:cysteine--tRNA ligase [Aliarcobacter thereius]OCL93831.1 Cysteine--tRNA ligase [Aliarcobacter thereius]OCL95239.1 Cysteine--tRNA ligase [Aliarcobacter thereius LMG 24486]OCL99870.1 Cysteine--tRNA ligase [Aliarcobacter thereius]QBF16771.1 cysteinyl-tRNA synthetase [Aliarcobacter thereius LMG 24486]TLS73231.1 cysteine--tRNA ligase [Aliarcobacter thereius]
MKKIFIFDSVKKDKVEFISIKENIVKIYVCGPTVYDNSHLGHARSAIAFDLLHRVLKVNNYEVIMAKNFTDIDDKIIKKMNENGKTLEDTTKHYIDLYKKDMELLNILPNSIEPKATQNLEEMKEMIENLLNKDIAYKTESSIYFDVSKDNLYGTLSNKISNETQARVENDKEKRNSADFALWKFEKANDVAFNSSFGKGRPGWHIECSAMIKKHLAYNDEKYQIDIHCGGADLLFPHHENEASQTRCDNGQTLAKYWMHNGFVNINGEKMSKSLGNSFFLKDVLKSYSGEVVRFYLLSTHYRADLSFNEEDLIASKKRLDKLYRVKKRVYGVNANQNDKDFEDKVLKSLNDDLNTSIALSYIDGFISNSNDNLDKNPKDKTLKQRIVSNIEFIEKLLGIGGSDAFEYFQFGIDEVLKDKIEKLIKNRSEAKESKDFEKADNIREELSNLNISIMDTANGTVWERL